MDPYRKLFYAYHSRFANLSPLVVIKESAFHDSLAPFERLELPPRRVETYRSNLLS